MTRTRNHLYSLDRPLVGDVGWMAGRRCSATVSLDGSVRHVDNLQIKGVCSDGIGALKEIGTVLAFKLPEVRRR